MFPAKINFRRLAIILFLGFSSGLPLALSGSTLQAWFTTAGISLVAIGALSLVGQPYVYKFIWAPLLDRYIPPVLGRRRGWLIITQVALLIAIAVMAFGNPAVNPYLLAGLGLLVAFLSATQDIAIDAYRTDIATPAERGLAAALTTGGYRVAMMVSGGIALILADKLGWREAYLIMAACMLVGLITSWFAEEPHTYAISQTAPTNLWTAIKGPFKEFLTRKAAVALLIFIILYKIGDALSISLLTPFLIRGLGFSLSTVGAVLKGVGLFGTMLGIFLAGIIMTRTSLYRALFIFGVLQIVAIGSLLILSIVGRNEAVLVAAIALDFICNGMGTTALVAFLMSICDHRYTATQFALLSAFSATGRVFTGPIAGFMVKNMGWPSFFICAVLVSIPGLLLLKRLKPVVDKISVKKEEEIIAGNFIEG